MADLNDPDLVHLVYQNAAEEVAQELGGVDNVNYRETRLSTILERVSRKACAKLGKEFVPFDLSMEPKGRASAKLAKEVLDESRRRGSLGGEEGHEDGERSGEGAVEGADLESPVLPESDRERPADDGGEVGDDEDEFKDCPF